MRIEIRQPVPLNSRGKLTVTHPRWVFDLDVRVAYVDATHAGLTFLYQSDEERSMVMNLVASLTRI